MRVIKKVPVKFYSCNSSRTTNKMPILAHDVEKHKLDVIHISEAGLQKRDPMGMTGYKSVKLARKEPNRGSVIWVRNDLMDRMVRVYAQKEEETGAEIIQLQMDTIPPTNIFGVYLETGKSAEEKEYAHNKLQQRVTECKSAGQNVILMGDFNAALNDTAKPFNLAAMKILEWEKKRRRKDTE